MRQIARKGNIDDDALMQYVIDGIGQPGVDKGILYGAKNPDEFKEKLKYFKIMCLSKKQEKTPTAEQKVTQWCYNCGVKGHKANKCQNNTKGTKCFKCNGYGHTARTCPTSRRTLEANTRTIKKEDGIMIQQIKIDNLQQNALFDSFSKFKLISSDICAQLGKRNTPMKNISRIGFGQTTSIKPIGSVDVSTE